MPSIISTEGVRDASGSPVATSTTFFDIHTNPREAATPTKPINTLTSMRNLCPRTMRINPLKHERKGLITQ